MAPGCVECHTTFAKIKYNDSNQATYNRSKIIYGVDCERCHGPSSSHVIYHQTFPNKKEAKFILKYQSFTRKQKLDACALCHSGIRSSSFTRPFEFLAGNNLDHFYMPTRIDYSGEIDVHGNQYGLLTASECFKKSSAMDCSTCHDPHRNERGNIQQFINKCISCHDNQNTVNCSLSMSKRMGNEGKDNCVSCHMPSRPSKSMQIMNDEQHLEPVYLRTHHIAIYKKEVAISGNKGLESYIEGL